MIDKETDLPTGHCLRATIHQHDGTTQEYAASKEWLLRRSQESLEDEAFLVIGAKANNIPIGGSITLQTGGNEA